MGFCDLNFFNWKKMAVTETHLLPKALRTVSRGFAAKFDDLDTQADTRWPKIYRRQFLNENLRIMIKMSRKFIFRGSNNNKLTLIQMMARRQTDDISLFVPMMAKFTTSIN